MGGAVWQKYFHTQNRKCPCLTPILGENMWFAFSIIWNKDENIHICILSVCFQKSFILIPCNKIKEQESMWKILLLPSDQIVHPKISLTPSVMLLQFLETVDSFWMCFSNTFLLSLHQWPEKHKKSPLEELQKSISFIEGNLKNNTLPSSPPQPHANRGEKTSNIKIRILTR